MKRKGLVVVVAVKLVVRRCGQMRGWDCRGWMEGRTVVIVAVWEACALTGTVQVDAESLPFQVNVLSLSKKGLRVDISYGLLTIGERRE